MAFSSIGKMLPSHIQKAGMQQQIQAGLIVQKGNELLDTWYGPQTTELDAKVISYKHQELTIALNNAGLKQQLAFKQQQFVNELNTKLGQVKIKRLKMIS